MSKMKDLLLMYGIAAAMSAGGSMETPRSRKQRLAEEEADFKHKAKKRAQTLSQNWNGEQQLHTFTIKGVQIQATDKKTAQKIYNLHHKK